jgi:hypothetical protein
VIRLLLALGLLCIAPALAHAHRASDSFLVLEQRDGAALRGHWDVALDDLAYALALDASGQDLTWGVLRAQQPRVEARLRTQLALQSSRGACSVRTEALSLVELSDGRYVRVPLTLRCPDAHGLWLRSSLLADVDRDHRTLLRLGGRSDASSLVIRADTPALYLPDAPQTNHARTLVDALRRGMLHIFEGADHIAFLLVLLLPALFGLDASRRLPGVWCDVAKVVTAFTLAHSLTLTLAGLGLVRVSSQVIEPAIAASVALAAAFNLLRKHASEEAVLAFALGLLHGFAFSSALTDAGLSGGALVSSLLGFNLGVELGQLVIVAVFVPLSLGLRRARIDSAAVLRWGSSGVLLLALFWFCERLLTG